jgi:hypothetical protein
MVSQKPVGQTIAFRGLSCLTKPVGQTIAFRGLSCLTKPVGQPILAAAGFQPAPPRFFMNFRGPQARCNRRPKLVACPTLPVNHAR